LDGDAVAYQVDEKMEVLPSKLCQEFSGFSDVVRTLPNEQPNLLQYSPSDVNPMFWTSHDHILLRECDFCIDSHRYIYYKRYTLLDSFDLFTSMHEWKSVDNHIGHDFDLFSTLQDALTGSNAWTFCNYDDAGVGMFKDCGPHGFVPWQWTGSIPVRGAEPADVRFYIFAATGSTLAPTPSPSPMETIERSFQLLLKADFDELKTSMDAIEVDLHQFAVKVLETLTEFEHVAITVDAVRRGSVIIDYKLKAPSSDMGLLWDADSKISDAEGERLTVFDFSVIVGANTQVNGPSDDDNNERWTFFGFELYVLVVLAAGCCIMVVAVSIAIWSLCSKDKSQSRPAGPGERSHSIREARAVPAWI